MPYVAKLSNAGGAKSLTRYVGVLAGNPTFIPFEPASAYESIAVATVPSGGLTSIVFDSIPQSYSHLQVRVSGRDNRSLFRDFFGINFNADFGNNYAGHSLSGDGSSASASAYSTFGEMQFLAVSATNANNATGFGACIIDVLDYQNTSKFKTVRGLGGYDDNGQGVIQLQSGLWQSTSAINRMIITPGSGSSFSENSLFALYGIKG
jgi:hypothetical protein